MKAFGFLFLALLGVTIPTQGWCDLPLVSQTAKTVLAITNEAGGVYCSAVAVEPHLVQTQAHCLIDGVKRQWKDWQGNTSWCAFDKVVENDGRDNVLIHTCREWEHYAPRAKSLGMYEYVFQLGHPMGLPMAYREGNVAIRHYDEGILPKTDSVLFDLNGAGGDSGGGVFNSKGELVCTISYAIGSPSQSFRFMGCYLPAFKQLR